MLCVFSGVVNRILLPVSASMSHCRKGSGCMLRQGLESKFDACDRLGSNRNESSERRL